MDVPALLVLPMSFIWLICYRANWQAGLKPFRHYKWCTGWWKKHSFAVRVWYCRNKPLPWGEGAEETSIYCFLMWTWAFWNFVIWDVAFRCLCWWGICFHSSPEGNLSRLPAPLFTGQPLTGLSDPQHWATGEGNYGSQEWKGSTENCLKAEEFRENCKFGFSGSPSQCRFPAQD